MKSLNYLTISLFFIYFLTLITGFYGPQLNPQSGIPLENTTNRNSELDESYQINPSLIEYNENKSMLLSWGWQPGLFQNFNILSASLGLFNDLNLENDSRPDTFLDELDRSYASTITKLILTIFWCVSLLLLGFALYKMQWYYRPMSTIMFVISILTILVILSTTRKIEIDRYAQISLYPIFQAGLEFSLALLTIILLLMRTLPYQKLTLKSDFMDHLKPPVSRVVERIQGIFKTSLHKILIMIFGFIISNLFLLPLYKIQINFQEIFVMVLTVGFCGLGFWYVQAYVRLAREKTNEKNVLAGVSFLGYKLLKNTLFIFLVITIVSIVLVLIVVFSSFNTQLLQYFQIIPIPESL